MEKDILVTAAELARRLKVSPPYISKLTKQGKLKPFMYGKKYYYNKTARALGKHPDDPVETYQKTSQQKEKVDSESKVQNKNAPKKVQNTPNRVQSSQKTIQSSQNTLKEGENLENIDKSLKEENSESLMNQILEAIKDEETTYDRLKLDGLKLKAGILKEYFLAENEKLKNRKMEENLFDRDEVMKILTFSVSAIRSKLLNLANNYAVNLEGMSKIQIKDFVTDDINRILSDLELVGEQFES